MTNSREIFWLTTKLWRSLSTCVFFPQLQKTRNRYFNNNMNGCSPRKSFQSPARTLRVLWRVGDRTTMFKIQHDTCCLFYIMVKDTGQEYSLGCLLWSWNSSLGKKRGKAVVCVNKTSNYIEKEENVGTARVLFENLSYGFYEFSNKPEGWKQNGSKEIWYPSWVGFCLKDRAKLCFNASVMSKW